MIFRLSLEASVFRNFFLANFSFLPLSTSLKLGSPLKLSLNSEVESFRLKRNLLCHCMPDTGWRARLGAELGASQHLCRLFELLES